LTRHTLAERLRQPGVLRTFLQPIFGLVPARMLALEALTCGPADSSAADAEVMFEYIRRKGMECAFDRLCVAGAFRAATDLAPHLGLAINVHAATLENDPGFVDFLTGIHGEFGGGRPLTLELVEHAPIWQTLRLGNALQRLRESGIAIAIDDVGAGHSTLRMLLEIRPEVVKIDRYLVHGAAADPVRREMLRSLRLIADSLQATVVAEGIETAADLEAVVACGITQGQGYYLATPFAAEDLHALNSLASFAPHLAAAAVPAE
jgi:EAL domain-containing protein (putative c-di-GMP-specific phosphodiesterase class I)